MAVSMNATSKIVVLDDSTLKQVLSNLEQSLAKLSSLKTEDGTISQVTQLIKTSESLLVNSVKNNASDEEIISSKPNFRVTISEFEDLLDEVTTSTTATNDNGSSNTIASNKISKIMDAALNKLQKLYNYEDDDMKSNLELASQVKLAKSPLSGGITQSFTFRTSKFLINDKKESGISTITESKLEEKGDDVAVDTGGNKNGNDRGSSDESRYDSKLDKIVDINDNYSKTDVFEHIYSKTSDLVSNLTDSIDNNDYEKLLKILIASQYSTSPYIKNLDYLNYFIKDNTYVLEYALKMERPNVNIIKILCDTKYNYENLFFQTNIFTSVLTQRPSFEIYKYVVNYGIAKFKYNIRGRRKSKALQKFLRQELQWAISELNDQRIFLKFFNFLMGKIEMNDDYFDYSTESPLNQSKSKCTRLSYILNFAFNKRDSNWDKESFAKVLKFMQFGNNNINTGKKYATNINDNVVQASILNEIVEETGDTFLHELIGYKGSETLNMVLNYSIENEIKIKWQVKNVQNESLFHICNDNTDSLRCLLDYVDYILTQNENKNNYKKIKKDIKSTLNTISNKIGNSVLFEHCCIDIDSDSDAGGEYIIDKLLKFGAQCDMPHQLHNDDTVLIKLIKNINSIGSSISSNILLRQNGDNMIKRFKKCLEFGDKYYDCMVTQKSNGDNMNIIGYVLQFNKYDLDLLKYIFSKILIENDESRSGSKLNPFDLFVGILEEKLGRNRDLNCLSLAHWSSSEINNFINQFYQACKLNDQTKMRSLCDVIQHNHDRAIKKYDEIYQQNQFCRLFLAKFNEKQLCLCL